MESYVISVSLGTGCYRHIQISANATLYKLHQVILKAFEFEDDHLHAFFMDNKRWSGWDMFIASKSEPSDRLTKKYSLQRAGLVKGKKFLYLLTLEMNGYFNAGYFGSWKKKRIIRLSSEAWGNLHSSIRNGMRMIGMRMGGK